MILFIAYYYIIRHRLLSPNYREVKGVSKGFCNSSKVRKKKKGVGPLIHSVSLCVYERKSAELVSVITHIDRC